MICIDENYQAVATFQCIRPVIGGEREIATVSFGTRAMIRRQKS